MSDFELFSAAQSALDELTDVVGAGMARDFLRLAMVSLSDDCEPDREVSR